MGVLLGLLSGSGQAAGQVWTSGSLVGNNGSDSANFSGFQLGPLRQGVQAVLINNTAKQTVELEITSAAYASATIGITKTYQTGSSLFSVEFAVL